MDTVHNEEVMVTVKVTYTGIDMSECGIDGYGSEEEFHEAEYHIVPLKVFLKSAYYTEKKDVIDKRWDPVYGKFWFGPYSNGTYAKIRFDEVKYSEHCEHISMWDETSDDKSTWDYWLNKHYNEKIHGTAFDLLALGADLDSKDVHLGS